VPPDYQQWEPSFLLRIGFAALIRLVAVVSVFPQTN
jgi:hypothetical protein